MQLLMPMSRIRMHHADALVEQQAVEAWRAPGFDTLTPDALKSNSLKSVCHDPELEELSGKTEGVVKGHGAGCTIT